MTGYHVSDGVPKTRAVLGDVTNQTLKRGLSDLGIQSGDSEGLRFAKQVCLGVENSGNENCQSKCKTDNSFVKDLVLRKDDALPTHAKTNHLQENAALVILDKHNGSGDEFDLQSGSVLKSVMKTRCVNASKTSFALSCPIPLNYLKQKNVTDEQLKCPCPCPADVVNIDGHGDIENAEPANTEVASSEGLRFPNSQDSVNCGLVRCSAFTDDRSANHTTGDLLEACSCSFCLKAAYIWSDLHYQDIKGRLVALKRSQKETNNLVSRYASGKQTELQNQGNAKNNTKLELNLAMQWGSLFRHMEDIFLTENHQLEAKFLSLKDLREKCKMDLDSTDGKAPDNGS